jgi:hypothetical protein
LSFRPYPPSPHPGPPPLRRPCRSRCPPSLMHRPYRSFHRPRQCPHSPLGQCPQRPLEHRPFRCSCRLTDCCTQPRQQRPGEPHRRGSGPCVFMPGRAESIMEMKEIHHPLAAWP